MEDYTDTHEFRIFGEEYLKYRHFLLPNSFIHMKAFVREGWTNRETGKKGEPRIQYNDFKQLQDVMETYAKKLTIQLDVANLQEKRIAVLKETLVSHQGGPHQFYHL